MRYAAYLASDEWAQRRAAYFAAKERACAVCGTAEGVQLHHLEYRNLGSEPDGDLLPLCQSHHDGAHAFHAEHSDHLTLRAATARYVRAQGGQVADVGAPKPPPRNHDDWSEQVTAPCPTCSAAAGESCVKVNSLGHSVKIRGVHKARKAASRRAVGLN